MCTGALKKLTLWQASKKIRHFGPKSYESWRRLFSSPFSERIWPTEGCRLTFPPQLGWFQHYFIVTLKPQTETSLPYLLLLYYYHCIIVGTRIFYLFEGPICTDFFPAGSSEGTALQQKKPELLASSVMDNEPLRHFKSRHGEKRAPYEIQRRPGRMFQQIAGCKTRVMIKLGLNQGFWSLVFVALPWWWAQTGLWAHTEWYSSDWFRRLENHHQPSKTSTNSTTYPSFVPSIKGFVCALPGRVKYLQALISGWYVYMLCNNHFFHGSNGYGSIPMGPSASGDIQFLDVFGCSWRWLGYQIFNRFWNQPPAGFYKASRRRSALVACVFFLLGIEALPEVQVVSLLISGQRPCKLQLPKLKSVRGVEMSGGVMYSLYI